MHPLDQLGLVPGLTVLFTTMLHEELGVVAASYLILERQAPALPMALILFIGIVAGDWLLYGLGVLARRLPWIRRWRRGDRAARSREWMEAHLVTLVVVARLLPGPGVLFTAFAAFGGIGVPFHRFARTTAVVAALYTPAILILTLAFGATVITRIGHWAWLALAVMVAIPLAGPWAGRLASAQRDVLDRVLLDKAAVRWLGRTTHRGMPPLADLRAHVSLAEHVPPVLFRIPLVLHWIALGVIHRNFTLPGIANPGAGAGALFSESRRARLDQLADDQRRWLAPYVALARGADADLAAALARMAQAGLAFPVVAKPDIGRRGHGVQLVHDAAALRRYLDAFPRGETVILQQPVAAEGEASILYQRRPNEPRGHATALTLRYFPFVVGDGASAVRELICGEPRANWKAAYHFGRRRDHQGVAPARLDLVPAAGEVVRLAFIAGNRVGALYRDGSGHMTAALERRIDAIARSMPDFHVGRFDIRFRSIERLEQGEDFAVIAIEGAAAAPIQVWDPDRRMAEVYAALFAHQKRLFDLGAAQRARGVRPVALRRMLASLRRRRRLVRLYPPSS